MRQIIKKALLSELDYKTYSNAAQNAYAKGHDEVRKFAVNNPGLPLEYYPQDIQDKYNKRKEQAYKFLDAARNEFNNKYGYKDSLGTEICSTGDAFCGLHGVEAYDKGGKWHGKWNDIDGAYDSYYEPNYGVAFLDGEETNYGTMRGFSGNQDAKDVYDRASTEMGNYKRGKYDYVKGKGWQLKGNLKESRMSRIIRESIKKVLNERHLDGITWVADEDDWIQVNTPEDGNVAYGVKLWCGSGYLLDLFKVYCEDNNSEEEALEKVVAYLDQNGDDSLFLDDAVERDRKEFENGTLEGYNGKIETEEELDEYIDSYACYVDGTMYGASQPHYVFWENLGIQMFPKNYSA